MCHGTLRGATEGGKNHLGVGFVWRKMLYFKEKREKPLRSQSHHFTFESGSLEVLSQLLCASRGVSGQSNRGQKPSLLFIHWTFLKHSEGRGWCAAPWSHRDDKCSAHLPGAAWPSMVRALSPWVVLLRWVWSLHSSPGTPEKGKQPVNQQEFFQEQ